MMLLSVIVPVFNEEENLPVFLHRTSDALKAMSDLCDFELIFVDDGSSDFSRDIIRKAIADDSRIRLIALSRNFGHQAALSAGYEISRGDAVVTIDCDLQDPPEVIQDLVQAWLAGADVVLARRRKRSGESMFKLSSAAIFYWLLARWTDNLIPRNVGDFRLLSREALEALMTLEESSPFYRGLVPWIGFEQVQVEYDRDPRHLGTTKYPLRKMLNLGIDGVTSFSDRPLRMMSLAGLFSVLISGAGGVYLIISKISSPNDSVSGWVSVVLLVLLFGGLQLFSVGLLGIYVSVINQNGKKRPRFIVWKKESENSA